MFRLSTSLSFVLVKVDSELAQVTNGLFFELLLDLGPLEPVYDVVPP